MENEGLMNQQLLEQMAGLKRRIAELEASESRLKQAEESLAKSEAKFKSIFEHVREGIIYLDGKGTILDVNETALQIYGGPKDELLGKHFTKVAVFGPRDTPVLLENFRKVISDETPAITVKIKNKRGREIWLECTASVLKPRGEAERVLVITRDITERKKAEETLRQSEDRFRSIIEGAPVGYYRVGKDGLWQYVNPAWERMHGRSCEEVVGKSFELTQPEDMVQQARENVRRSLAGETITGEFGRLRKDGEVEYHSFNIQPVYHQGEITAIEGFINDITERKRAGEALRQSEERYRVLFDSAPVGIGTADLEGNVIAANERMQEITGYAGEDLGSINLKSTYVNPGDREHLLSILRERGTVREYEVRLKRKDGSTYDALLNVDIVDLGGRKVVHTCVRDITEQKRAEMQIHELSQFRESIIETANVWLDVLDERANVVVWNKAAEEISGYSREEVLGHGKIWEWLYPDEGYRNEITTKAAAIIEKGEVVEDFETIIRCKNGDSKIISWHSRNLLGEKGNPIGSIALGRDVTERKKAEEALRASEEKFYKAFHTTSNLMGISTAKEGRIIDINDAYCGVVGYKREELIGRTTAEFSIWADPEQRNLVIQKLREEGRVHDLEVGIRNKSGDIRTVLFSADAITLNNERSLINMAIDITERKRAEEALRKSEERYRTTLDNMLEGCQIIGYDWRYLYVNDALAKHGRQPKGRLLGRTMMEMYPGIEDTAAFTSLRQCMEGRIPHRQENEFTFPDGTKGWFELSIQPVPEGIFVLSLDITERKKAEKALREALTEVERLRNRLEAENIYLQEEIKSEHDFEEIIGRSEKLKEVLLQVEQVAPTDSTVLILGETGTGKELIARAIHGISARQKRPLVKVNCSALPASLIESELFGYVKGAFTGATSSRIGRFELADGATILLDEIGDLPLELQVKLLRVLQDGEFERLGDPRTITVDVRVIAATNRDLEKAVEIRRFREDLYYRLNVFPITSPPLRERRGDIPMLVKHFVSKYGLKTGKRIESIPQKAMEVLQAYDWPGNVRELENVVERSVITSRGDRLELGEWLPKHARFTRTSEVSTLKEVEKSHILSTLKVTGWRVSGERGAARMLGINPKTLESRMKRLGIRRPSQ